MKFHISPAADRAGPASGPVQPIGFFASGSATPFPAGVFLIIDQNLKF
jgi:hypothetical protein